MAQQDTRTLAGGCFGKVYREKYKDQWACIKRVPIGLIRMTDLERECKVYRNAQHLNVVKLLGDPWLKESKWNIPLEFITGEELETTIFCSQKSKIKLTSTVRATIISGMCAGLFHLHSKDIVHQDIKPDNIMVEHETNRPVIIDLGLAKFFKDGKTSAINVGNEAYSAPEILLWQGVRDKRSDVWAMGKVIAELCARVRLPTHAVTPSKIQETLAAHPYSVAVSKMVDSNPDTRIPMALVMADIKRAEGKVREEEARAGEAASAHPGLKAGVGLAGVANDKTGLHQRGGLNVPSPAEAESNTVTMFMILGVVVGSLKQKKW
ncbi:CBL-interacting protein kinase 12 [Alosa sapidissima]|uniref:CBL-interacting protein kinase 12 n=1 Tax=Alosa sapidissima TaxID=34773 RepID=UPI001C098C78|nr:CBL-interacting protein kinase 12 [Alosa sapidissima]